MLLGQFYGWVEKKSSNRFYVYYLTFFLAFLSLFFATPKYLYLDSMPEVKEGWEVVRLKAHDLTNTLTQLDADSHAAKTVFRLTVPVFVKLFGTNQLWTYLVQFIFGFILITQLYKLSLKSIKNTISASLVTAGIVFLYFGRACFVDFSWYDGWAFFGIIMAMQVRNPILVCLFCLMAAWTDERALIVLPIVLLYKQMETIGTDDFSFKNLIRLNKSSLFVALSIVIYLVIRGLLTVYYDMHTPSASADFATFKINIPVIGIGLWTFFEGFWMLCIIGLIVMVWKKNYILLLIVLFQLLISTVVAFSVFDITRSGSYLVPLVFVFLIFLKEKMNPKEMNFILFSCFLISFLFPAYYIIGELNMYQPIYYEFLNYTLNKIS